MEYGIRQGWVVSADGTQFAASPEEFERKFGVALPSSLHAAWEDRLARIRSEREAAERAKAEVEARSAPLWEEVRQRRGEIERLDKILSCAPESYTAHEGCLGQIETSEFSSFLPRVSRSRAAWRKNYGDADSVFVARRTCVRCGASCSSATRQYYSPGDVRGSIKGGAWHDAGESQETGELTTINIRPAYAAGFEGYEKSIVSLKSQISEIKNQISEIDGGEIE